jgi:hypothetical protein
MQAAHVFEETYSSTPHFVAVALNGGGELDCDGGDGAWAQTSLVRHSPDDEEHNEQHCWSAVGSAAALLQQ